jgi:hypothetical protein
LTWATVRSANIKSCSFLFLWVRIRRTPVVGSLDLSHRDEDLHFPARDWTLSAWGGSIANNKPLTGRNVLMHSGAFVGLAHGKKNFFG